MGFIMDGLEAEGYDRSYSDRQLVGRIVAYFRPKLRDMLLVSGAVVTASLTGTAVTLLVALGIDRLADGVTFERVAPLVLLVFLSGCVEWGANFIRQWRTAVAVGDVVLTLRKDILASVVQRDMSFYDEFLSGKIVSRVTSDTEDFATVVTLTLGLLSQVLLCGFVLAALLIINPGLALVALTIAPVVIALSLGFRKIARRWIQRSQRARARVNANVQEMVSGITIAKNFRQEVAVHREFRRVNRQAYQASLRTGYVFAAIFPLLSTVSGIGTALIVFVGGNDVIDGAVSAGELFLFAQAVALFWFPLTSIASFWSQFQLGLSASERVFALIDAEPRVVQTAAEPVERLDGRIEFRDVDFEYAPGQPVLRRFNLEIRPGESVALVGHTGAGKSSIGRLVARFYEFQAGELLIDGRDIRRLDLAQYRRKLGIVPQVPFLFSGTVSENIRYALPGATEEDALWAAKQVGHGDWLEVLPNGLQTEVGEAGRGISLGQRQLIALARLILQNPAIIILDEATASVDPLTEAQIQEGLDVVLAGCTSIVIAHRLSTIRNVDRIVVLDHGRIVEEGTHDALMLAGGHYADLYNTYFRHQSPDYQPGAGFVRVHRRRVS
ncbi:MAG: ABC transporter ATP-binding protein [Chloroflexi bacterium]|nr:MAG: ABC transporter ATP-binding protein [Chloroflexota bacterium]